MRILILLLFFVSNLQAQSVGINEDGSSPHSSALLHLKSDNKGLLIPRLDSVQRLAISSPAIGLIVFDTDYKKIFIYEQSSWVRLLDENALNGFDTQDLDIATDSIYLTNSQIKKHLNEVNHWKKFDDTLKFQNGPVWLNDDEDKPAIIFDNDQTAIFNSYNTIQTERQWLNILLDKDDNQTNAHLALFNNGNTAGSPQIKFNVDGNDSWINSGSLGIGTETPGQKLEVDGAIKIGAAELATLEAGTIRWNEAESDFEGWNGSQWLSLTNVNQTTGNENTGLPSSDPMCCDIQFTPPGNTGVFSGRKIIMYGDYAAFSNDEDVFLLKNENGTWSTDTTFNYPNPVTPPYLAMDSTHIYIAQTRATVDGSNDAGKIYIWEKVGDSWNLQDSLTSPIPSYNERFGRQLQVSGEWMSSITLATGSDSSVVYIYRKNLNTGKWNHNATISPPAGEDFDLISFSNERLMTFGDKISFYHRIGNVWGLYDTISTNVPNSVGNSIAIDNDYSIWATNYNKFYVIKYESNNWSVIDTVLFTIPLAYPGACDLFGDYVIIGSSYNQAAETFHFDGQDWLSTEQITDPIGVAGDAFGYAVAIDGVNKIIGVPNADANGNINVGKIIIGPVIQ